MERWVFGVIIVLVIIILAWAFYPVEKVDEQAAPIPERVPQTIDKNKMLLDLYKPCNCKNDCIHAKISVDQLKEAMDAPSSEEYLSVY